jgi:hypothetical protein
MSLKNTPPKIVFENVGFKYDRQERYALRGEKRKTVNKIEPHLIAEGVERSGSGTISFLVSFGEYVRKCVKVLAHGVPPLGA